MCNWCGVPRSLLFVPLVVLGLFLSSCGGSGQSSGSPPSPPPPPGPLVLAVNPVVSSLNAPVDLQSPHDGSGRLFVVEQQGMIRIVSNASLMPTPFLDIHNQVDFGGEKGLLGLAFHLNYSQNRRFFLNYDRVLSGQMQTVIAEFQTSPSNPNQADPASERILFTVNQPFPNHKGGQLTFGPDGFLYIGLGDGGSAGDPLGNGQSLQTLLGKMLRIDVDHTSLGLPLQFLRTIHFSMERTEERFGPTACAIPGASHSMFRAADYSPAMLARTDLRKSISCKKVATSAGTSWKACTAFNLPADAT
jgi:Glucose / Sorbosone dehydrogenase